MRREKGLRNPNNRRPKSNVAMRARKRRLQLNKEPLLKAIQADLKVQPEVSPISSN